MHHYRNDETDVFFISGTPTLSKSEKPHLIVDYASGRIWLNNGGTPAGVAATFYLAGGGAAAGALTETLTEARVLTAADVGKTFFLSAAGGFDITLPALTTVGWFRFIVLVAPTTAYTITGATADKIVGHVLTGDDAHGSADTETTAGGDAYSFVANKAVIGDWCEIVCNGTLYFASGRAAVFDGATITG